MRPMSLTGINKKQLQRWLLVFFLTLVIPMGILVRQAYTQLKWEAFHHHRILAEELTSRIDQRLIALFAEEEQRTFTDFSFLNIAGEPSANFLQRSPLSAFPVNPPIPGLLGYFQVDTQGVFSTPLLPQPPSISTRYGISAEEFQKRQALEQRIQLILSQNSLVPENKTTITDALNKKQSPSINLDLTANVESGLSSELSSKFSSDLSVVQQQERESTSTTAELRMDKDSGGKSMTATPQVDEAIFPQAAFDKLGSAPAKQTLAKKKQQPQTLGRVEDLKLDSRFQLKAPPSPSTEKTLSRRLLQEKNVVRKERSILPKQAFKPLEDQTQADIAPPAYSDSTAPAEMIAKNPSGYRIDIFESEIDAFEMSLLGSGHFVLYRKVWRNGQRYIQGALLEPKALFHGIVETAFRDTALSQMSNLAVAYQGNVFSAFSSQANQRYSSNAGKMQGTLLYQSRLTAPLSEMQLIFSINQLPAGPGAVVVNWVAAILVVILCGGFYLMYRLGLGQIHLARHQQDFVSAVSHELKTPLTSIRMYGEILREGWADESKKKTYYNYIHDESERLSRLINNVLQLARMTRNDLKVDLHPTKVAALMDGLKLKINSQIERAGFVLNITCDSNTRQLVINADADFFTQIIINLVDNAIKFSAGSAQKTIDINCQLLRNNTIRFSVRDYGPGVPKDQMKKIFKLFYRSENELTRETIGTGIGLALVHQLTLSMKGDTDVVNQQPGAEFRVTFPLNTAAQ